MATTATNYVTASRHTFTMTSINSLASDGYASTDIYDNTTLKCLDAAIYGELIMGSTAASAADLTTVYLVPIYNDSAEDFYNGDLGSNLQTDGGNSTLSAGTDFVKADLIVGKRVSWNGDSSEVRAFVIPSVASAVGGLMPEKLQLIVFNGADQALAASPGEIHLTPTKVDTA